MNTKAFWLGALERALKTFAQTMVALLGADAVNLVHVTWLVDLPVAGGAAFLSVLTSLSTATVIGAPAAPVVERPPTP